MGRFTGVHRKWIYLLDVAFDHGAGRIPYSDGTDMQDLPIGAARNVLQVNAGANGVEWAAVGGMASHPYVLTVGTNQQYPDIADAGTAAQALALSANQRCIIMIFPGTYTLRSTLPLDEYIDWTGLGDTPEAVRIQGGAGTDVFQDSGTGSWSVRNLTVVAGTTGACLEADAAPGTMEDVILEGTTGPTLLIEGITLTIEGRVVLRAGGGSTVSLLRSIGSTIEGHGVLEVDDEEGSGAGLNFQDTASTVRLEHLGAHSSAATGDAIYSNHAGNVFDIKDGRITGWDDGIHAADTAVLRLGPLVFSGTNTYDINVPGEAKCTLYSSGAAYSLAKVGTPGNLTTYGPTEDQDHITQRRCYLYDSAGGIDVGTGAWVDITWATEVVKDASWSHAANSAEIELLENASAGITIHYDLCVYAADGAVKVETRLVRSTGGGSYGEVSGSRDYTSIPSGDILSLHRAVMIPSQLDGDKYKLQAQTGAVLTTTTVADHSGITFRRDY